MTRLLVVVCLVASSCGGSNGSAKEVQRPVSKAPTAEGASTSAAPTTPAALKKAMAEYEAAWVALDAEKAASAYTEDAVVKMAGAPPVTGRAAIKALIAASFGGSKDGKAPFTRKSWIGNIMIGEWVWGGTHSGTLFGIPATGKSFGVRGVSIYVFSPAAKLKQVRMYFDVPTLMAQLGVSKSPARPVQTLPTDEPVEMTAGGTADERRNIAAVNKMNAALAGKREAEFLGSLADYVEWDDMTMPTAMKGKQAAKKAFQVMTTAFPDLALTATNTWAVGNIVIHEGTMTGTHKGALGRIPPTNKSFTAHGVDIVQVGKDGKIVRVWSYGNSMEMLVQLGLVPAPKR